ncbi:hypothetical protein CICLE_v10020658mg [Citrus x clementina]|uniref:DUF7903 domain-containing protein n=1 Tax=Citrus clementina TaxID=85681 RepID=V4TXV3_CITCL|nr:hypothetical protein CICLE_v10020658mg [Citrus x clementina]
MAYIPPHMRHTKDPQRPSPVPEMIVPKFNRKLNLGSSKHNADISGKIVYADPAIHRWFICGLDNDSSSPSVRFVEFSDDPVEHKKSTTINLARDNDKLCGNTSRSPWESIAENVWPDVLSACNIVKNEMEEKPTMVARFGHHLFRESDILSLENAKEGQVAESALSPLRRCFYTGVPPTYMGKIVNEVVPKIGVGFVENKDIYHVKLSDGTRQITCKCTVELNSVRHMVADMLCVHKNLDLRLALCSKSTLSALSDDEMNSIRILINSAIPDPEVKGGLRWPMGKSYSGDYTIVGVWHNEFKSYKSPSLKLKVRNVDRFIFKTGTGEATIEINLKLRRLVSEIQDGEIDTDSIYNGFNDNLRLIWDHFLSWES